MEGKYKLRRITYTIFVFLVLTLPTVAQSMISSDSPALLEVVHSSCSIANCSDFYTRRIYVNGASMVEFNIIERAHSGPPRRVQHREETQLKPAELAAFVGLTEKADFLNASREYIVKRVVDSTSWVTIKFHKEKLEKQVTIYNYLIASPEEKAKLPASVLKIIELSTPGQ